MHSHAIGEVAASLAMDGMPLTESEKDDLEAFDKMTKEEQEHNIQGLVEKYKTMGKKDHSKFSNIRNDCSTRV